MEDKMMVAAVNARVTGGTASKRDSGEERTAIARRKSLAKRDA